MSNFYIENTQGRHTIWNLHSETHHSTVNSESDSDSDSSFDFDSELVMVVPSSSPPTEYFSCEESPEAIVPRVKRKRIDPVLREPTPLFVTTRHYRSTIPDTPEHTRTPKTYHEFLNNIKWEVAEDPSTHHFSPKQLYDEMSRRENISWSRLTKRVQAKWINERLPL